MNGTVPISTSTSSSRLNEPLFKPQTVTDNIQPVLFADIRAGQAGKGTTRPPLSRNPPERLLKKIAELKQTNSMEAQADHQVPLASPIHLIPSHSTVSGPQATFPSSRSHGPRPAPQNGIHASSPSEHLIHASLSRPSPNPHHPNHRAKIISSNHYIHPSPPTPKTAMPSTRSKPAMLNASILTPAPGMPRRQVPVLVSPLKIMFDNACRGIYSELSHFQSSCVAMMTRERKEKEMLKAHYFQMKRERDAARERVTLLEGSSLGTPPTSAPPAVLAQPDSSSQIRGVSRKRRRESFEPVSDYPESVSPSASSSASSCSSAPRTPSPSNEAPVAMPCVESFEILYPESRLSTSPPPPPISSIHNAFHTPSAPPSSNRAFFCTPSPRSNAQPLGSATSTPLQGRMARIPIPPSRITSSHSPELVQPNDSETLPVSKRLKASITVYPSDAEAASTGGRYFDVLKSSSLASPTSSEGDVRNVEDNLVNFDEPVDMDLESDDDSDADIPPTMVPGVGERGSTRKMVSRTPSFVLPSLREMYPGYPPLSPKQQCTSILDIRSL